MFFVFTFFVYLPTCIFYFIYKMINYYSLVSVCKSDMNYFFKYFGVKLEFAFWRENVWTWFKRTNFKSLIVISFKFSISGNRFRSRLSISLSWSRSLPTASLISRKRGAAAAVRVRIPKCPPFRKLCSLDLLLLCLYLERKRRAKKR